MSGYFFILWQTSCHVLEVGVFSLEFLVMTATILFCLGGLVGALLSRTLLPSGNQKGLESSLQNARDELTQYQQEVASHFAETSRLVHGLTQSYKDVHNHLAKGAISLTNAEITEKMIAAGEVSLDLEAKEALQEQRVEQPKDWAPKQGALSEDYGLDDFDEDTPIEVKTSKAKTTA